MYQLPVAMEIRGGTWGGHGLLSVPVWFGPSGFHVSCRVESSCAACQVRVPGSASGEWRTRRGMRCGLSGRPGVYCGWSLIVFHPGADR